MTMYNLYYFPCFKATFFSKINFGTVNEYLKKETDNIKIKKNNHTFIALLFCKAVPHQGFEIAYARNEVLKSSFNSSNYGRLVTFNPPIYSCHLSLSISGFEFTRDVWELLPKPIILVEQWILAINLIIVIEM
jgi:hypothetical protein